MPFKLPFDPRAALGLLNKSGPPVAVDFGACGIKLLSVSSTEPPALIAAAFEPTPAELLADPRARLMHQFQTLPRLIASLGFRGRRAVCAIPAGQTFCKHLQIAKSDGVAMGPIVQSIVAGQVGCSPSALVYHHVEVAPAAEASKIEVVATAVSRELVDLAVGAFKAAKMEIVGMHGEFIATMRAFDYINRRTEDADLITLYLDIGYGTTKVVIGHGHKLAFVRSIEFGGRNINSAIMTARSCTLAQAIEIRAGGAPRGVPAPARVRPELVGASEAVKRPGALSPKERRRFVEGELEGDGAALLPPELDEPLEILADDVEMCLRYHEALFNGRRPHRMIFQGGESRDRALCHHLARRLRIPAQVADPLARVTRTGKEPCIGVDLTVPQPGWSVPLGLCLSPTDL